MLRVWAFILISPLVASHDVAVGLNSYGRKIFDENRQASPAIWRQKENVTIEASENEVISKVLVIDMRPEKDGDAKIVDGGEKQKNVTIELKSPTVFRGYDFHIEVYAVPTAHVSDTDKQPTGNSSQDIDVSLNVNNVTTEPSTIGDISPEATNNEEPAQFNLNETIRNARNLNMEIENESIETTSITLNSENETDTNAENATTESSLTTLAETVTTNLPEILSTDQIFPDFPLTGIDGDETRHIRKIGDDLYTTTAEILSTSVTDSTTVSYTSENETDTTTVSDISTTTLGDESATMSSDRNGKDILDFDDLLSTDGEEARFARHTDIKSDSTTMSSISTTEDTPTTTTIPDLIEESNATEDTNVYDETRHYREALYNATNETGNTDQPLVNNDGAKIPPILQIIIENGAYDTNIVNPNESEYDVNESSGDYNSTEANEDSNVTDDISSTTIASTDSTESSTEEQFRKGRGISGENDIFNPDTNGESEPGAPVIDKSNVGDDYVYVPILAVISKHNYPIFKGVLDNISMNVAFPSLETNPVPVTYEMPDDNIPVAA